MRPTGGMFKRRVVMTNVLAGLLLSGPTLLRNEVNAAAAVDLDEVCRGAVDDVVYTSADEIAAGSLGMLDPLPLVDLPGPDAVVFEDVPLADPSWTMYWLGLTWLMPLAEDPDHRELAVEYAARFQDQTDSTAPSAPGWDEGTNLRRLQALVCIKAHTDSDRFDTAIEQSIDAAKDPGRYPNVPWPNNHVIMINQALISAGEVLGRPDLIAYGLDRLANDWRIAWSPSVFDLEQASAYVANNIGMWNEVADTFDEYDRADEADALRSRLDIAKEGLRLLMTPAGPLVPFGDSGPIVPPDDVVSDGALTVIDTDSGIAAGRTSWDDDATHWTLRFGPPRADHGHGHSDAMSVTWFAAGENVLVDPGNYSYGRNRFADWDHNPSAHNVAVPTGPDVMFLAGTSTPLVAQSSDDVAERFTLMSAQLGVTQTRQAVVFREHPVIVVVDEMAGPFTQSWHLDPTWAPTGDGWVSGDGSTLRAVSTSSAVEQFSGDDRGGWVFPRFGVAEPAVQVMIEGEGAVTTAWVLGDVDVTVEASAVTIDGERFDLSPGT